MNPVAFISSLSIEHTSLRRRLYDELGDAVWVAEHSARELSQRKDDLEIVDTCTDFIERARCFVCIFAGRRGTRLTVGKQLANATHFETELFHAAALRRPFQVFVARGFKPDSSLREIVRVLQASIDSNRWTEDLSDDEILSRVERLVATNRTFSPRRICHSIAALLLDVRGGPVRADGPGLGSSFVREVEQVVAFIRAPVWRQLFFSLTTIKTFDPD